MSYCTLYTNQDKIKGYYNEIQEASKKYDSGWQTVGYILTNIIERQWKLRREYYNKNLLMKHKYEVSIKDGEYIEYLFQHIFLHGYAALNDEVFESIDAINKWLDNNDDDKMEIRYSLIIEELIDVLFFICENTSWCETLFQLTIDPNKDSISAINIENYLVGYNGFSDRIKIMIDEEGHHISTYCYDFKDDIKHNENYEVQDLLTLNREYLRQSCWKDWKIYEDGCYNPSKLGELFKLNREMYKVIFNLLYHYMTNFAKNILNLENYNPENHISEFFKLVYACFMTKAEVNERRQLNDKNYNPENTGESEGVLV